MIIFAVMYEAVYDSECLFLTREKELAARTLETLKELHPSWNFQIKEYPFCRIEGEVNQLLKKRGFISEEI